MIVVEELVDKGIRDKIFPGAAYGICYGLEEKRKKITEGVGRTSYADNAYAVDTQTLFDLASLTKPMATVPAIASLIQQKKIFLTDPLSELLETDVAADKKDITLFHLLSHSSGLPAHRPYYQLLGHVPVEKRKEIIVDAILAEELQFTPGRISVYSDLGFMLLGHIVEIKTHLPFDQYVYERIFKPMKLPSPIFFNRGNIEPGKSAAATENCPWRHTTLQGVVSDENAYWLGGVAGHAGLFADVEAVLHFAIFLLDVWKKRRHHPAFDHDILQKLLRCAGIKESTWALGFDTPSPEKSSSGRYFSAGSRGHLGFTGTSFWIDPERELVVVLLTNRVHPCRDNEAIKIFRPQFHDAVMEHLWSMLGEEG